MNWDMKKTAFFVQSTEKSTKRIEPSFSHTDARNKEKKKCRKDVALLKKE
jgi:hypothetical protein